MTPAPIERLANDLRAAAEEEEAAFSGVVVVRHGEAPVLELAMGMADRAHRRPMTLDTRLGIASGTKGFTALAAVSMIEAGLLDFYTPLVEVVGNALPHVDPAVTIEHLLGHTSGVGDYIDEDSMGDIDDHTVDVPVDRLEGPEDYLELLNRHPQVEPPGARFRYNNSGYVMLALAIERAGTERTAGGTYHDEVRRRVFEPAAMTATDFLRSDRLPAEAALGYLTDGRTNVFHLPVIGTGDGGAYTTGADMLHFWEALFSGRIVSLAMVNRMTAPPVDPGTNYGLGFWLAPPDRSTVQLEGMDAGVSFQSGAEPTAGGLRYCLIANNSSDVWPLAEIIAQHLRGDRLPS